MGSGVTSAVVSDSSVLLGTIFSFGVFVFSSIIVGLELARVGGRPSFYCLEGKGTGGGGMQRKAVQRMGLHGLDSGALAQGLR